MIKACLFDIGNVLVSFDYRRTFPALVERTARTYDGIQRHLGSFHTDLETGRMSSAEFIGEAVRFLGPGVTEDAFLAAFTGIFEPLHAVWDAVRVVREVVPVHLFSNTSELHETGLFRDFPQFSLFHGGFYSWRIGSMKPDDGMYETALATLGVRGDEIAYIDDLPANIATGRRHGFHSLQFDKSKPEGLTAFLRQCGLPAPD